MANNKITWVNFLHIYQPPWQDRGVIEQISAESYEYLLALFEKYPQFKCTLNIVGSLVDQLAEVRPDLLKKLVALVKKGQIELTGSAKYHALLPLIDSAEIERQIKLNQETLNKYFDSKKISGFYLPEMAFDYKSAEVVKHRGFHWLILDPMSYQGRVENDTLYLDEKTGLNVVFRDREISKTYPAEAIFHKLRKDLRGETIVTATDGEIYGHHHEDWQGHLEKILGSKNLEVVTVSEYIKKLQAKEKIILRPASWESTVEELGKKIPFALWADPKNKIHKSLWRLVKLASQLVSKYQGDKNWHWSRNHLDRGLSSCTFWWASAKKPSDFSPLTWNPDMIDNGSEELIRAVRSLDKATSREKIKAEKIYIDIKKNTWLTHWLKYHK